MKDFSLAQLMAATVVVSGASGWVFVSLLDASIKSCLLIVIATMACLLLVRVSAATRYLIWAATLAGVIAMPVFVYLMPNVKVLPDWLSVEQRLQSTVAQRGNLSEASYLHEVPIVADDTLLRTVMQLVPAGEQLGQSQAPAHGAPVTMPWELNVNADVLLSIWLAGFAVCVLPIAFSYFHLRRIERSFRFVEQDRRVIEAVSKVARELNTKMPRVIIGPAGTMPMVWSFGRSRLLLPVSATQWSVARLRSVLLHELVHLRRHDPAIFLVGLLSRGMNWFNPLVWYALARLRVECERACDDHVLRTGVEPDEYAGHLLELATKQRPVFGTGTLAMAMVSKPKIESRIVSILDHGLNRCGVTRGRAIAMLVAVSVGVATLAALAANPGDIASPEVDPVEPVVTTEDEVKWPHCVLTIDDLKPRSLEQASAQFNKQSQESPTGSEQPPITVKETKEAITKSIKLAHVSEEVKNVLSKIVKSGQLPANVYFRRFTRFDDEREFHSVWWVRLVVEIPEQTIYSVPIRTENIFTRPYTQLERQQNSEPGVTLINRFSSYFEGDPKFGTEKAVDKDAASRLVAAADKALKANNVDDLRKLFDFTGVSKPTRKFVNRELKLLFKSKVHSIQVSPRRFEGKLIHWSAYQRYKPNLPVVGYLDIVFTPESTPAVGQEKISFELGVVNNELRLVNYITDGEMNLPKGNVSHSIRGHTEPLVDGTFELTTIVTSPGSLLSAHLSNEEIWQRDFNKTRAAAEKAAKGALKELGMPAPFETRLGNDKTYSPWNPNHDRVFGPYRG